MGGFEKRMSCWDGLKVDSVWRTDDKNSQEKETQEAQPRDSKQCGVMAGLQEIL